MREWKEGEEIHTEREKHHCQGDTPILSSHTRPAWGQELSLQPRYVPLSRISPVTFQSVFVALIAEQNQLEHQLLLHYFTLTLTY